MAPDPFAAALAPLFGTLGKPGTLTAPGGQPVAVKVLFAEPDAAGQFGMTRLITGTFHAEIRVAEVADIPAGSTLAVEGKSFTVKTVSHQDPDRLIHTLQLVPA